MSWRIVIQGTGPHGGEAAPGMYETDADRLASIFVRYLRQQGHEILKADFQWTADPAEPVCTKTL